MKLIKRWAAKCMFYNEYGPTETTVTSTLKNLGALYRRQGKFEAAQTLEMCASRCSTHGSTSKLNVPSDKSKDAAQYNKSSGEEKVEWRGDGSGTLRRSGSFNRLRASLRRSSARLVSKFTGASDGQDDSSTPSTPGTAGVSGSMLNINNQQSSSMKRATSLGVLNSRYDGTQPPRSSPSPATYKAPTSKNAEAP